MALERYGLLVVLLIVLVLSTSNFAVMNQFRFFYPTAVTIYGVEPIREMFPKAGSAFKSELQDIFAEVKPENHFSILQKAKYNLGCYSGEDTHNMFDDDTENTLREMASSPQSITRKLRQHEATTIGQTSTTVCSCIDHVISKVGNPNHQVDSANVYHEIFDNRTTAALNPPLKSSAHFWNLDLVPDTEIPEFQKYLVEFCAVSAEPVYTTKFEGVINVRIMVWVGQIFLVAAILFEISQEGAQYGVKRVVDMVLNVVCAASILWAIIAYFVYSMQHTNHGHMEDIAYREKSYSTFTSGDPLNITFILIFVVLFINYIGFFLLELFRAKKPENGTDEYFKGMNQFMHLNFELIANVGWALLILSLGIQAKKKDIDTLATLLILIFTVGVVRFTSRSLHDMYNRVCLKLDKNDITTLQTLTDYDMKIELSKDAMNSNSETVHYWRSFVLRRFLRAIGMLRFGAFITILLISVLLILVADVSVQNSFGHNTKEGQYLYAIIAFFLFNACSDILLEMIPLQFDDNEDNAAERFKKGERSPTHYVHTVKYYILAVYLLWLNTTQMSLWRHELMFLLKK